MKRPLKIRHEFVEFIPKVRDRGVLYISIPYATAVHDCFCGCGHKVVTPISCVGWVLTYNGEAVTLWPSVGNWGFPCRSHYFIRNDTVVWAADMTEEMVQQGRARDRVAREHHFGEAALVPPVTRKNKRGIWARITNRH
jgi:hypothetical protein